jgi:hypothetical protein
MVISATVVFFYVLTVSNGEFYVFKLYSWV